MSSETSLAGLDLAVPAPPSSSGEGSSDVVPPPAPPTGSEKSKSARVSAPRLSLGRHGAPALEFSQTDTTSDDVDAGAIFTACIACICVLACLGGAIACTVFTIIFLVDDENKSSCWDTTGKAIWTYVIVRMVLGCCSSQCIQTAQSQDVEQGTAAVAAICSFMILFTLFIYGGVVIFANDVCDGFKNTGLYQMYYILYIIDVVTNSLLLSSFTPLIAKAFCGIGQSEAGQPMTNTENPSVDTNAIKLAD
jgi:hypothetical protein